MSGDLSAAVDVGNTELTALLSAAPPRGARLDVRVRWLLRAVTTLDAVAARLAAADDGDQAADLRDIADDMAQRAVDLLRDVGVDDLPDVARSRVPGLPEPRSAGLR